MNAISQMPQSTGMPIGYLDIRSELAPALMRVGAVLTAESKHDLVIERPQPGGRMERGFKLKLHEANPDAPLSPVYFNLRTPKNPKAGPLTPEIVEKVAKCMVYIKAVYKLPCDAVVGVPNAGDPFAEAFADITGIGRLELTKFQQGDKRSIGGVKGLSKAPQSVRKVILVDDLLTKADSKIEAVHSLRKDGFEVSDLIVLVDREQGGVEALAKHDITVHSVFTAGELLDAYVASRKLTPYMRAKISAYLVENS